MKLVDSCQFARITKLVLTSKGINWLVKLTSNVEELQKCNATTLLNCFLDLRKLFPISQESGRGGTVISCLSKILKRKWQEVQGT